MVRETEPAARLDLLAEEFVERLRNGERPEISDYATRFPELEAEIRDLFPTLAMLEQAGKEVSRSGDRLLSSPVVHDYIADYRILREIGRGGMGIVYEAEHHEMRRRVALKLLPQELASNPLHLRRFRREARAAGGLHHTNIVPVFEVGQDKGIHYYSMQYIHGQSLDLVIAEMRRSAGNGNARGTLGPVFGEGSQTENHSIAERLLSGTQVSRHPADGDRTVVDSSGYGLDTTAREASFTSSAGEASSRGRGGSVFLRIAGIGLQVADALAYAHGQGVLHRDIKPANLLLDSSGTVWITDFGLARYDEADLTRTGNIVGTLRYLAPERLNGQADARSDVYALGLTLYELCTLRPAFDENDRVQLVRQVTTENPVAPRKINPHLPRDLETIILKAIEKQPSQRYSSAAELAEDLQRFLSDRPLLSRRAALSERVWRWCRRNPAVASLIGCVAALLAIVFVGAIWFAVTSRQQSLDLLHQTALAKGSELRALSALYSARVAQARAARQSGRRGQRVDGLSAIEEAVSLTPGVFPDKEEQKNAIRNLRDEAIACLANPDFGVVRSWQATETWLARVAFDTKLEKYAQGHLNGTIVIRRVSDDAELARFPSPGDTVWGLKFSPDGNYLEARYHPPRARVREICVWDVRSGEKVLSEQGDFRFAPMTLSPDGKQVWLANEGPRIRAYDLEQRKFVSDLATSGTQPFALAADPTGTWLAIASAETWSLELHYLPDGKIRRIDCPGYMMALAWTDDGQWLAGGCSDGKIFVWNTSDPDRPPQTIEAHQAATVDLIFNHQGDRLLSFGWDGNCRLWDVESGSLLVAVEGMRFASTAFSPDDRRIGFHGNWKDFGIWEIHDHGPTKTLGAPGPVRWGMDFVAGHANLALASTSGGIEVWNTATGRHEVIEEFPKNAGVISGANGKSLFVFHEKGIVEVPFTVVDGLVVPGESGTIAEVGPAVDGEINVRRIVASDDGSSLGALIDDRLLVYDLKEPGFAATEIGVHTGANQIAISPDGRWMVSTTWHKGSGVQVWDRLSRKMVVDLFPDIGKATAEFSPDGKWLVIGTGSELVLWETGTWTRKFSVDRDNDDNWTTSIAFSPDSSLFAGHYSRKAIQLVSTKSGERQAILETTEPGLIGCLRFNSSGDQLGSVVNNKIQIWDLSELRQQLARIGLDWASEPD